MRIAEPVSYTHLKRVVVALYEAEVNIVAHAWRGTVVAELDADKISLELKDEGPGIPDISLAMREGYSTASEAVREMGFGAGMGLPNMKKNVDELTIESQVDVGTTVRMVCLLYTSHDHLTAVVRSCTNC